ncbi:MAG TPA: 3-oxoacyl-[acyl-carrier-protein] synthase III C-terminal domain-containing protein [Bryobacteraceae bacterium]|jgi:alkylresorcinol/alkylpyrone synthase
MKILSAASAFPQHYYPQEVLLTALRNYWAGELSRPETLDRLHSRACVDGRYLAYPMADYYTMQTFGDFNRAWMKAAEELGNQALCRALSRAGVTPREIDAIFFVSVTGVCSPSIDAKLVNRMRLSPHIKRIPIFGLGCVAGAAGISRAADYVRAFPDHVAALVSVELCSLTLQKKDLSVANLISSGLFGDGAAAVLVAGANRPQQGPEIIATRSTFYPDSEYVMGWDISEKGFQIVLSPSVPEVIREHLGVDLDAFLGDHGLTRRDISSWIMHTGGPKVLEATQDALGVGPDALRLSWECLRKTGNLSSASVLCVLEQVMEHERPRSGDFSVLAAAGPGFCSELVLLKWP